MDLGRARVEQLELYAEELAGYERANVVGTRDLERLWLEHVLDSLSCLLCEPLRGASSLIDVGSGGGMPGIPIHVAIGPLRTFLLESTAKKAEFLRRLSASMSLEGLEVANSRAEKLGHEPGYRERFEAVTVRAVDSLAVISEYCLPFLEVGGTMVAMKGRLEKEERKSGESAAKVLGGELQEVIRVPFSVGRETKERHLTVIRKARPTPQRYPREVGSPRKSPLGAAR